MKPRRPAAAFAFLALFAAFFPAPADAAERDCPGMTVQPDAGFRARFPDLLARIQSELAGRADVDACASVGLQLEGDQVITMSVTLPDGRAASRTVTRPDDVIPTLQALLLVPSQPTSERAAAAPAKRSPPQRHPVATDPTPTDRDVVPTNRAVRRLGFELSLITGARIGDGQVAAGAGALSFLELHSWLLGFEGRADSYRALAGGDPETALELAVLAGRRFDLGSVALDFTAGPAVAMKGLAFSQSESVRVDQMASGQPPVAPPARHADPSSGPVPRLLLGARLGFSPRSLFRTFVGIDGEVGPARVADDAPASSARLPGFSLGLALGATVGTP
jgi:hypothetical protein